MNHLTPINLLLILSVLVAGCATPSAQFPSSNKSSIHKAQNITQLTRDESGKLSMRGTDEDITEEAPLNIKTPDPIVEVSSYDGAVSVDPSDVKEDSGQNLLDTALDFCDASQVFWSEGNLEEAIEALDQAYNMVLSVDTENNPKLIQQKEDLRFLISKRVLEIYASRYTAVNGSYEAIPLVMNAFVEKEIKRFQGPERKFFIESYRRSGKFRDMILKKLKEAGMPEELAWLPLIESGFKIRALSSARALGLWQFIPSTGYKFGLNRDNWVDERLHPEKATDAAIAYMTELHNIFGDWSTVLAAYNCGEGRVLRVIRAQRINYLDNFWDLYQKLPRETARYVPRFIATLHILKNPEKFGFTKDDFKAAYEPETYDIVTVDKTLQLKTVASVLDIPYKNLTDLNPELRYQVTPSKPYRLKVPVGKDSLLLAKLDDIPKWYPPEKVYVYHKVRNGETLSLIASKYRSSVEKIVRANNIRKKHLIRVGQKLKVPVGGSKGTTAVATAPAVIPAGGIYKVKKGDSLWLIARKFNTDTKKLKRINNLRSTRLSIGQTLKVTDGPIKPTPGGEYKVRKGDSLWLIARKFNMDTKSLQRINNLQTTRLQIGQVLKVKN